MRGTKQTEALWRAAMRPDGTIDAERFAASMRRWQRRRTAVFTLRFLIVVASAILLINRLTRPTYPPWSPRLLALANTTATLRSLEFRHPVAVVAVAPEEFDRDRTYGSDAPPDKGRQFRCIRSFGPDVQTELPCEPGPEVGALRALGLRSEAPLGELGLSMSGAFTVARYDSIRRRIEVRGSLEDVPDRVLVHELVHVLHHQNFGLRCGSCLTNDEFLAYLAITEGDAERIATAFVERPPTNAAAANEQLRREENLDRTVADRARDAGFNDLESNSDAVVEALAFPYTEGQEYVSALIETGGIELVNERLRQPPIATAEVLQHRSERLPKVPRPETPQLPIGDDVPYNPSPRAIGAWYWREVFRQHDDWESGEAIAHAWRGEWATVSWNSTKQRVCLASHLVLGGTDAAEASEALAALSKKLSDGSYAKDATGGIVQACDPTGSAGG